MLCLLSCHPAEEHGHGPRTHLVIRDFAGRESGDEVLNFLGREGLPFAFFLDQSGNVHAALFTANSVPLDRCSSTRRQWAFRLILLSGMRSRSAKAPSARTSSPETRRHPQTPCSA